MNKIKTWLCLLVLVGLPALLTVVSGGLASANKSPDSKRSDFVQKLGPKLNIYAAPALVGGRPKGTLKPLATGARKSSNLTARENHAVEVVWRVVRRLFDQLLARALDTSVLVGKSNRAITSFRVVVAPCQGAPGAFAWVVPGALSVDVTLCYRFVTEAILSHEVGHSLHLGILPAVFGAEPYSLQTRDLDVRATGESFADLIGVLAFPHKDVKNPYKIVAPGYGLIRDLQTPKVAHVRDAQSLALSGRYHDLSTLISSSVLRIGKSRPNDPNDDARIFRALVAAVAKGPFHKTLSRSTASCFRDSISAHSGYKPRVVKAAFAQRGIPDGPALPLLASTSARGRRPLARAAHAMAHPLFRACKAFAPPTVKGNPPTGGTGSSGTTKPKVGTTKPPGRKIPPKPKHKPPKGDFHFPTGKTDCAGSNHVTCIDQVERLNAFAKELVAYANKLLWLIHHCSSDQHPQKATRRLHNRISVWRCQSIARYLRMRVPALRAAKGQPTPKIHHLWIALGKNGGTGKLHRVVQTRVVSKKIALSIIDSAGCAKWIKGVPRNSTARCLHGLVK